MNPRLDFREDDKRYEGFPRRVSRFTKGDFLNEGIIKQIGQPPLRIDILSGIDGVKYADAKKDKQYFNPNIFLNLMMKLRLEFILPILIALILQSNHSHAQYKYKIEIQMPNAFEGDSLNIDIDNILENKSYRS